MIKNKILNIDGYETEVFTFGRLSKNSKLFIVNDGDIFRKNITGVLEKIQARGMNIILLLIKPKDRFVDYIPWPEYKYRADFPFQGGGDSYLESLSLNILVQVKKYLNLDLAPKNIYLLGASLGGLISLYGLVSKPNSFGGAVCISSSFWYDGFLEYIEKNPPSRDKKIYMDIGDSEKKGKITLYKDPLLFHQAIYQILSKKLASKNFCYLVKENMSHRSEYFLERLYDGIEFIYSS